MSSPLAMSRAEREAFLAEPHVGVISIPEEGRGPLTVPIWYAYEPGGELHVITERSSRKGRLLEKAERLSLVAQTEALPYKYVSVEGPVLSIRAADRERDARPMAHRYLGPALGDRYIDEGPEREPGESVVVRVRPERWLSVDYAKQFGEGGTEA